MSYCIFIFAEHAKTISQETRAHVCWIVASVVSKRQCEQNIVKETQMGFETHLEESLSKASAEGETCKENEDRQIIARRYQYSHIQKKFNIKIYFFTLYILFIY